MAQGKKGISNYPEPCALCLTPSSNTVYLKPYTVLLFMVIRGLGTP